MNPSANPNINPPANQQPSQQPSNPFAALGLEPNQELWVETKTAEGKVKIKKRLLFSQI